MRVAVDAAVDVEKYKRTTCVYYIQRKNKKVLLIGVLF